MYDIFDDETIQHYRNRRQISTGRQQLPTHPLKPSTKASNHLINRAEIGPRKETLPKAQRPPPPPQSSKMICVVEAKVFHTKPIIGHWSKQEQEQILFVGSKITAVAALSCDHSKLAGEEQNFVKIDRSSIQACQKKSQNTAHNISFPENFAGLPSGHHFVPLEHHLGSMQTTLGNHFSQNGQNFGTLAEQLNITETNSMVFETTLGQL